LGVHHSINKKIVFILFIVVLFIFKCYVEKEENTIVGNYKDTVEVKYSKPLDSLANIIIDDILKISENIFLNLDFSSLNKNDSTSFYHYIFLVDAELNYEKVNYLVEELRIKNYDVDINDNSLDTIKVEGTKKFYLDSISVIYDLSLYTFFRENRFYYNIIITKE